MHTLRTSSQNALTLLLCLLTHMGESAAPSAAQFVQKVVGEGNENELEQVLRQARSPTFIKVHNRQKTISGPFSIQTGNTLEGTSETILVGSSILDGQGMGEIRTLSFTRSVVDLKQARLAGTSCVDVLGGQWRLEDCTVRIGGGVAMKFQGSSSASLLHCSVGGIGGGPERAGQGLMVGGDSRVAFDDGEISDCLAAVSVFERGATDLSSTKVRGASYAFGVDQSGTLHVAGSHVEAARQGVLIAGSEASKASLRVEQTTMEGVLWFGEARPGQCTLERNLMLRDTPRVSKVQAYQQGRLTELPPKDGPESLDRRVGERPGSCFDY